MFWRKARPTAGTDTIEWMLETWEWLDGILLPVDAEPPRQFIYPSRKLFPDTDKCGHARAEHYFALVQEYAGLQDLPVTLRAQAPVPDIALGWAKLETGTTALGTFQVRGNTAVITYDPGITSNPVQFIATMAHELAHYALAYAKDAPPGGEELMELATDLATVHMGFGLFGANTAFNFEQRTDYDRQGWQSSRSGYLGEGGWCFACALFAEIVGAAIEPAYTKASVAAQIAKNRAYLSAHPEIVRNMRSG